MWMGVENRMWVTKFKDKYSYLFEHLGASNTLFSFKATLSYYLLFNQLIPLALVIVTELAKIFQTLFIQADALMHSTQPCKCLNFQLHEDLGSIKHVFSDKTGTLTCNRLIFRGCAIGNRVLTEDEMEGVEEGSVMEKMFIRVMCLCNDVVIGVNGEYQGASTDEITLLTTMKRAGWQMAKRIGDTVVIKSRKGEEV